MRPSPPRPLGSRTDARQDGPELVFAIVGAVGTDLAAVIRNLEDALRSVRFDPRHIHLSRLLHPLEQGAGLDKIKFEDDRIEKHMDAGNALRREAMRADAMAGLAVFEISALRAELGGHGRDADVPPRLGTAYILNSLKHPEEVAQLRAIYGTRLSVIAVHSPEARRAESLTRSIAESHDDIGCLQPHAARAEQLIERDQAEEEDAFGQNVRDTFALADVFVSTADDQNPREQIERFVGLLFGYPFHTPTRLEYAMVHAQAAALRSSDLSRQVGAVIATESGDIISAGCNEVPRPSGGQYWCDDSPLARDVDLGFDSNTFHKQAAIRELFEVLKKHGALGSLASATELSEVLVGTRISNLTEFGRPVHAEMAAILDAARRGVPVAGQTVISTTFPCHNCTRHLIAAGIREVIFREPYAKSLAAQLHPDAIEIDPLIATPERLVFRPFVGVAPSRYFELFAMPRRKDALGQAVKWDSQSAHARFVAKEDVGYLQNEVRYMDEISSAFGLKDLAEGAS